MVRARLIPIVLVAGLVAGACAGAGLVSRTDPPTSGLLGGTDPLANGLVGGTDPLANGLVSRTDPPASGLLGGTDPLANGLLGGTDPPTPPSTTAGAPSPTSVGDDSGDDLVRIMLVGDVMLGRGVARIAAGDPEGLFERVRFTLEQADLAAANLESPLTLRPHIATNPNDLTADPAGARLLAAAGFDLMSLANNHAGDAGRASVTDTVTAVESAGMVAVGAGTDLADATAPRIVDVGELEVAFLAFDATRAGWAAGASSPGIARWDDATVQRAVESAAAGADLVIVSVHGGIEYLPTTDPGMAGLAAMLSAWGADVVWGHHSHVVQPVYVEGTTLVSTSLGNFLFDQGRTATQTGAMLEVMADTDGVVAYRVGLASHADRRVRFQEWLLPEGDGVWLDGGWWTPVRPVDLAPMESVQPADFPFGSVTGASLGDLTGDGRAELVVSYRHESRAHLVRDAFPDRDWEDARGRTAHLAVMDPDDPVPLWAGGALFQPVAEVAACGQAVALAFDTLDDPTIVATGAWVWTGFGFTIPPELPGPGVIGCADIDGDGTLDPVVIDRSSR